MYDNIFSAELVLVLLHDSLIKSGKSVGSFGHPEGWIERYLYRGGQLD